MAKHVTDHRPVSNGGRTAQFLRLARLPRVLWHRTEVLPAGNRRVVEFLRIARGREA